MNLARRNRRWIGLFVAAQTIAIVSFVAPSARALDPARKITQYIQTSWSSESGLPQNSVHAIAQTADGYIWLGTEEGLARFDGVHFTIFSRENSDGLASDYIRVLVPGPHGSLWIGTDSGLSYYEPLSANPSRGAFRTLTTKDGLSADNITALCEDRDGAVWVGTSAGLNRLVQGHIENWTAGKGLPDLSVRALVIDSGGTLWVGTQSGLSRLDHGRFVAFIAPDGRAGNPITALAAAPDGSVWVGILGKGIEQIRHGQVFIPSQPLPSKDVDALLTDRDGNLWMAFDRHGIGRLSHARFDLFDASQGLPSNRSTHAMFEDREGNLWIGLLDAGVVQLRDGKFSMFGKPEGLSGNYIGNVLQAQDGSMWIGADSNGLNHLLRDGRVEVWNHRKGLLSQAAYSMLQVRDGSLWIGYKTGLLARIRAGRISIYTDPQAVNTSLNALLEDREGRLWVGFYGKGLAQFENGIFRHITRTEQVSDLAESPDGALWIATDGDGVERLIGGAITHFTAGDGLPSNHVMSLYADDDGSIWAGTASGGLSHIRGRQIQTWTYRNGLPAATVGSIVEDNFGNLWMGSDSGIFRISKQELAQSAGHPDSIMHPVVYGTSDGLRSRETVYGASTCTWKGRDGRLWFATIAGAAVIDPARIPIDTVIPPVWIEQVAFDAHPVSLENGIRLGPGSGNLQVTFTAPSFIAPQKVRFRYRLSGYDSEWTNADSRRTAWYTNLPPGHYTFEVQAENSDGISSRTGASLSFVLLPPLTRTPLAYVGYGVLAILLVWGAIAFRTRRLTRRQQELTRIVAERTAQLEAEKKGLEEARRELRVQATHDSLTGLYNRRAMIEHLEREIARAGREKTTLGVLIADLDHFKRVNDRYGHLCGDDIIREAAERLRAAMRSYDIVGRYGGEEFLILLPNFDLRPSRIDDLLDAIRSQPFQGAQTEIRLTCSIGVGTFHPGADLPEVRDVISRADTALYAAKDAGRNCAKFELRNSVREPECAESSVSMTPE
jgi:diguanylate cyclase (GGDEF)-like protein